MADAPATEAVGPRIEAIRQGFRRLDLQEGQAPVAVALPWRGEPHYHHVRALADGIAQAMRKSPKHFQGIAMLPLIDTKLALKELDRAVLDLGLKGLCMLSNVAGKMLDSGFLLPIYERAQQLGVPIFIHPTTPRRHNNRPPSFSTSHRPRAARRRETINPDRSLIYRFAPR